MIDKPSWSADGKWIVFFRLIANRDQEIKKWKTTICAVKPDGSDLRILTSGQFADFNPTWTREGLNYILINRYDPDKNRNYIYRTTVDSKPGEEILISDPAHSEFGFSGLKDGRIIVSSGRGGNKNYSYLFSTSPDEDGYYHPPFMYILTPEAGKIGKYDHLNFQYKLDALPSRLTLSPGEKRVTYEYDSSWGNFSYAGHPLVTAEIDINTMVVSNAVTFSTSRADVLELYPAFTCDEKAIVYFSSREGSLQFYCYNLSSGKTLRVSNEHWKDYRYFCGEASPK